MQLFAVAPKDDCPHVTDCLQPLSAYAHIDINSATCQNCPEADENWLCLTCAGVFCSRYKNEHGLFHFLENETHRVWLSFADLSFWCHTCDSYIVAPELPTRAGTDRMAIAPRGDDGRVEYQPAAAPKPPPRRAIASRPMSAQVYQNQWRHKQIKTSADRPISAKPNLQENKATRDGVGVGGVGDQIQMQNYYYPSIGGGGGVGEQGVLDAPGTSSSSRAPRPVNKRRQLAVHQTSDPVPRLKQVREEEDTATFAEDDELGGVGMSPTGVAGAYSATSRTNAQQKNIFSMRNPFLFDPAEQDPPRAPDDIWDPTLEEITGVPSPSKKEPRGPSSPPAEVENAHIASSFKFRPASTVFGSNGYGREAHRLNYVTHLTDIARYRPYSAKPFVEQKPVSRPVSATSSSKWSPIEVRRGEAHSGDAGQQDSATVDADDDASLFVPSMPGGGAEREPGGGPGGATNLFGGAGGGRFRHKMDASRGGGRAQSEDAYGVGRARSPGRGGAAYSDLPPETNVTLPAAEDNFRGAAGAGGKKQVQLAVGGDVRTGSGVVFEFRWTPGHMGNPFNDYADYMASQGLCHAVGEMRGRTFYKKILTAPILRRVLCSRIMSVYEKSSAHPELTRRAALLGMASVKHGNKKTGSVPVMECPFCGIPVVPSCDHFLFGCQGKEAFGRIRSEVFPQHVAGGGVKLEDRAAFIKGSPSKAKHLGAQFKKLSRLYSAPPKRPPPAIEPGDELQRDIPKPDFDIRRPVSKRKLVELQQAALAGDRRLVKAYCITNKKYLHCTDDDGFTPLLNQQPRDQKINDATKFSRHYAAIGGSGECFRHMLYAGADPEHHGKGRWTAAHAAAANEQTNVLQVIKEECPELFSFTDEKGWTPMEWLKVLMKKTTKGPLVGTGKPPNSGRKGLLDPGVREVSRFHHPLAHRDEKIMMSASAKQGISARPGLGDWRK
eukprot:g17398.t1